MDRLIDGIGLNRLTSIVIHHFKLTSRYAFCCYNINGSANRWHSSKNRLAGIVFHYFKLMGWYAFCCYGPANRWHSGLNRLASIVIHHLN